MMKIKPKKKISPLDKKQSEDRTKRKKKDVKITELKPRSGGASKSLGTLEELKDPNYLPNLRSKHREGGTLDLYCEMLETQIGSLVDKILSFDLHKKLPEKDTEKALRIAREQINAASNELSQAQQYFRDEL